MAGERGGTTASSGLSSRLVSGLRPAHNLGEAARGACGALHCAHPFPARWHVRSAVVVRVHPRQVMAVHAPMGHVLLSELGHLGRLPLDGHLLGPRVLRDGDGDRRLYVGDRRVRGDMASGCDTACGELAGEVAAPLDGRCTWILAGSWRNVPSFGACDTGAALARVAIIAIVCFRSASDSLQCCLVWECLASPDGSRQSGTRPTTPRAPSNPAHI